mmetsp:Transcript_5433/g.11424  ORF Transcript_5433/g.11424 Transcript_5433/m.11424 type:complete len:90 (+) Transcript_5433:540-809(+)
MLLTPVLLLLMLLLFTKEHHYTKQNQSKQGREEQAIAGQSKAKQTSTNTQIRNPNNGRKGRKRNKHGEKKIAFCARETGIHNRLLALLK